MNEVNKIRLRACEPEDLELLYRWENNPDYWCADGLRTPYSRYALKQFILSSGQDIHESRQMRLMVERVEDGAIVGAVDLFDFDSVNSRAGVGILIAQPYQGKGLATESLHLIQKYAFSYLQLHQLYAHIAVTNPASLRAFAKAGFKQSAILKDWLKREGKFIDVIIMNSYQ